jgi:hypothetical protein
MGSEPDDFLQTTEAAEAKRFTWGGNHMALSFAALIPSFN